MRVAINQSAPVLVGVLPGRVGKLIHEAFQVKLVLRSADRCPNAGRNVRLSQMIVEPLVGDRIGNLVQASNGLSSVLWRILVDTDDTVDPGHGPAVRPQASLDSRHAHRAIVAVARRFLAAPDDLHRTVYLFGDHHCLPHVSVVVAAAKSTANKEVVDVNVLWGDTG